MTTRNTDRPARAWSEVPLFDADWNPDDGEQVSLFGDDRDDAPVKLWPS